MSDYRVVHQGFDKLDVAFSGGFDADLFPLLSALKEKAQRENEPQLVEIGPGSVPVHVFDRGMRGGYAFHLNTGPIGANFYIKENVKQTEWNLFSTSLAEGLLAHGFTGYFERMRADFRAMGATLGKESVNRVDYAVDFACSRLDLRPELFVCPPRTKSRVHYSSGEFRDDLVPIVLTCGRRVESVTAGKMPGRQLIVYNKGVEAQQKRKRIWPERWGFDPREANLEVWRAELRAGKHELKERYGLTSFRDVSDSIGDVFRRAVQDVRYISDERTDSNVTRAEKHPLWIALTQALGGGLNKHESGLLPGRIIEIGREELLERCAENISGNALSYACARGLSQEHISKLFPDEMAALLRERFEHHPQKVAEKLERVRRRYRFIAES